MGASVKIMLSYDYNHFEVCLTTDNPNIDLKGVDDMRKDCQRLADKAVLQYQTAKRALGDREYAEHNFSNLKERFESISFVSESERTPEQKAIVKAYRDCEFAMSRAYDYQDDWEDQQ